MAQMRHFQIENRLAVFKRTNDFYTKLRLQQVNQQAASIIQQRIYWDGFLQGIETDLLAHREKHHVKSSY